MKKLARTLLLVSALLAGLQLGLYLMSSSAPETAEESFREPAAGPVLGIDDEYDTHAWLGIPYAQSQRWQAPKPVAIWDEAFEASSFGDFCLQHGGPAVTVNPLEWGETVGSENCQYLNIWAPRFASNDIAKAQSLPVMLWIHGGGNSVGRADSYQMARLASTEKVIVVSINYRLGAFGWFSHSALRQTSDNAFDASGNYGTLDMIESLNWVQNNIAAFGGDPDNVTIFGESAGGRNVLSLLASKPAKGLFHRAIVQSGLSQSTPVSKAENFSDEDDAGYLESSGELLIKLLMADNKAASREQAKQQIAAMSAQQTVDYLRAKTAAQILQQYPERSLGMYFVPQLIRDGVVLPSDDFINTFADPEQYNVVPIMIGSNRDEMKLFLIGDASLVETRWGLFRTIISPERFEQQNRYLSDFWKANAVDQLAAIFSRSQPGLVWAYRFDWDEGDSNMTGDYSQLLGAAHSLEMPFIFGQWSGLMLPGVFTDNNRASYEPLSKAMMAYWGAFATEGDPANGRGSNAMIWESWSASAQNLFIVFDSEAGGGIRMSDEVLTIAGLKQRLAADQQFSLQRDRCKVYVGMFFQKRDWLTDEYQNLPGGGCRDYTPESLRAL